MRTILFLLLCLCALPAQAQQVIHVNAAAPDGGDGTSWASAFRSLQNALAAAAEGDTLWVAHGKYRPDDGEGITPGDRDASFVMKAGLQLLGGFRGDETTSVQRDPVLYETVLTGDLLGNDSDADSLYDGTPSRQDNSIVVMRVPQGITAVVVSGITLTGGHQGGAVNARGALLLENCIISRNMGDGAVSIHSDQTNRIVRSVFSHNAGFEGGGLHVSSTGTAASVFLKETAFLHNHAWKGGGVFINSAGSLLQLDRCHFERNVASEGGAIFAGATSGAHLWGHNTIFVSNEANGGQGGAILAINLSLALANSVFVGNLSYSSPDLSWGSGGAIYVAEDDFFPYTDTTYITGSTFFGNVAERSGASLFFENSMRVLVHNSIFAGGSVTKYDSNDLQYEGTLELAAWRPSFYPVTERTEFSHTLAEGGLPYFAADLGGNLDAAPGLCDPLGPDGTLGTADDDLRPCPGSPAIDAGDNSLLPTDALDLDSDGDTTEPLPVDFAGRQRIYSTSGAPRVDIGAFEADAPSVAAEPNEQPDAGGLSVRLYPNPARAAVQVHVASPASNSGTLAVFDVMGREILRMHEGALTPTGFRLDTTALPSGLYFVRLTTSTGIATSPLTILH